jgi:hypothetical protein
MNFCEHCQNMLEIKLLGDPANNVPSSLGYVCKTCDKTYSEEESKSILKDNCVYSMNYNIDSIKRDSVINKYTYLDVTLPRVKNVKCPNPNCAGGDTPEISYIKYDDERMKYVYICCDCQKAKTEPSTWYLD